MRQVIYIIISILQMKKLRPETTYLMKNLVGRGPMQREIFYTMCPAMLTMSFVSVTLSSFLMYAQCHTHPYPTRMDSALKDLLVSVP